MSNQSSLPDHLGMGWCVSHSVSAGPKMSLVDEPLEIDDDRCYWAGTRFDVCSDIIAWRRDRLESSWKITLDRSEDHLYHAHDELVVSRIAAKKMVSSDLASEQTLTLIHANEAAAVMSSLFCQLYMNGNNNVLLPTG